MYGATAGQVGLLRFDCAINQAICAVVPNERLLPNFLFWVLKSQTDEFKRRSVGGAQQNLSQALIKKFKIPLPPLDIQKAIVQEIDGFQKIIDGARQVVENYKPVIKIDPGWEMVELGEIATITSSKRIFQDEYVNSGIPFYRTKEIVELSKNKPISLELFISEDKYRAIKEKFDIPKKGDILVSAVGTIGVSWVVTDNRKFYFKDGNLLWIKDIQSTNSYFLKTALDFIFSTRLNEYIFGAAYNALTIIKLKRIKIPLPPLSVQQKIVAQIEAEQEIVNANKRLIDMFEQKIKDKIAEVWGG